MVLPFIPLFLSGQLLLADFLPNEASDYECYIVSVFGYDVAPELSAGGANLLAILINCLVFLLLLLLLLFWLVLPPIVEFIKLLIVPVLLLVMLLL